MTANAPTQASVLIELWRGMRPRHWTKNIFIFAPLVFARELTTTPYLSLVAMGFVVFCALTSGVYLLNDLVDREKDRAHPVKRHRPIAAGRLSVPMAQVAVFALTLVALVGAGWLSLRFTYVAVAYLLLNLAYSTWLKRVVIVDVMVVATGFLLRAWAGAVLIDVKLSHWLLLCTGLVAMFLGFVKRRQELVALQGMDASDQRPILREYSLPFLDQMIATVTACTVLAYALYAFSDEVTARIGSPWMGATVPFVLFGIFRYLYLAHQRDQGENPTEIVTRDAGMVATVILWALTVLYALYAGA
ncbi:MAG: decaprenyl-phosphate phosphoribosyltransferase [Acidobacteriota bacterium]|nr:decaprenyl-phosphate phosphoribosyltransferase [Acidobacteriota bacterium]MDH3785448.1 decaprenyl-phosphate phosphoribosyltransferase [Acidobacteriota bacterium]